jgi:hypothetical protein
MWNYSIDHDNHSLIPCNTAPTSRTSTTRRKAETGDRMPTWTAIVVTATLTASSTAAATWITCRYVRSQIQSLRTTLLGAVDDAFREAAADQALQTALRRDTGTVLPLRRTARR